MKDTGLVEVKNLSEVFLSDTINDLPDTAIVATLEGNSTILLEVQALTSTSYYNNPRRVATGVDLNRLNMILAVLEKKCGINIGAKDVYVSLIGGIRIDEPAIDLGVAMAIISNVKNRVLDNKTVYIGEIGLTGQIRSVLNAEKRIKEISKMGFKKVVLNKKQANLLKGNKDINNIEIIGIDTLEEACKI